MAGLKRFREEDGDEEQYKDNKVSLHRPKPTNKNL
jgi:hypothetical protein